MPTAEFEFENWLSATTSTESSQLKIAVISDVHIGPQARAVELCPVLPEKADALLKEPFFERFESFVKAHKLTADALIVAGDITSSAAYSQFCVGAQLATKVAHALGVQDQRIFFVPGNHDVDWQVLNLEGGAEDQEFRWRHRYLPLKESAGIFSNLLNRIDSSLTEPPYCGVCVDDNLVMALTNSAWHDRPKAPVHYGGLPKSTLSALDAKLSSLHWDSKQVRILVVHHHPLQYQVPTFAEDIDSPDFSILQNAEKLLALAKKHRIDLLVHGHKHIPRFQTHLVESTYPIQILGAGSFSVRLDSSYSGSILNQFHMIEVIGRRPGHDTVYGALHSWEYAGANNWRRSESDSGGIASPIGFGFFASKEELRLATQTWLDAKLAAKPIAKWIEACTENDSFKYAHPTMVEELLTEYADAKGYVLHGDDPTTFLLLKEAS